MKKLIRQKKKKIRILSQAFAHIDDIKRNWVDLLNIKHKGNKVHVRPSLGSL